MPLIHLTTGVLVMLDVLAWFIFHLGISFGVRQIADTFFERNRRWFRSFPFEKQGVIWEKKFRIKKWKDKLPDGTVIAKRGFDKSRLGKTDSAALKKFIIETQRAELTHWLLIAPAFLFFLWNPKWAGWVMVFYALLVNVPFIMIQRYNRPRLERALIRKMRNN
ncbi:glycosyl-4,4'-diaponeurosporenoate acyltransferase CrtO family protein [Enterococcus mundtii]|uniref:Glycosyl-4,4'-diaponeurosporenoate acyltransferase n=1 Tax=Enterococcus mundtii TaxID=53346 RepID=A0A2S7RWS8_ENTMU|nr:glycosyl-4,4'-diaponeurosporenoate acyltransferase [Enterococcus mundtii]PQF24444.1 glycosyl-4,4'-diaponeurosporenoate acyltransferase [Enterococcus mundtii]PTO36746.1 glycosyl-4,4'-diaponeurosporenoate acyltransferase [Enterococcus mundtii]PTO44133.1 glycosyl-4,4'-diaponeurosporenoate acyltransferase [Enterococcus mundtii]